MSVIILSDKCTGCEICVSSCPFGAIEMKDDVAYLNEACTHCGMCVEACEFEAIVQIEEEKKVIKQFNISKKQFPKNLYTDIIDKTLKAEKGSIIKITRKRPTADESSFYRVVVDA